MLIGLISFYVVSAVVFYAVVVRTAVEMEEAVSFASTAPAPVLEVVEGGADQESVRRAA